MVKDIFKNKAARALLLTTAVTLGGVTAPADAYADPNCGRVVGYGDSQANGFALATQSTSLAIDGKGLYTSALKSNVAKIKPGDNVFISLGSNDLGYVMGKGEKALNKYKDDLKERLQDIIAKGPNAVVVMIPSTGDYPSLNTTQEKYLNETMAGAVRDVATDLGLGVIETRNSPRSDGLHLKWSEMKRIKNNEFAKLTGCR